MDEEQKFITNALIIGEQARASMLWGLLDGKAYTATELAVIANISRQSASNHLSKMLDSGLLIAVQQGRHRYYSFANDDVAYAIESLANLIPEFKLKKTKIDTKEKKGIYFARTCYDHLAGELAVKITGALIDNKFIIATGDQFTLSEKGSKYFTTLGINIEDLKKNRRAVTRACLDWTERRNHLAGSLGAELLNLMLKKDLIRRVKNSREIIITPGSLFRLKNIFGITF